MDNILHFFSVQMMKNLNFISSYTDDIHTYYYRSDIIYKWNFKESPDTYMKYVSHVLLYKF